VAAAAIEMIGYLAAGLVIAAILKSRQFGVAASV
jgi:hypothetical protein